MESAIAFAQWRHWRSRRHRVPFGIQASLAVISCVAVAVVDDDVVVVVCQRKGVKVWPYEEGTADAEWSGKGQRAAEQEGLGRCDAGDAGNGSEVDSEGGGSEA